MVGILIKGVKLPKEGYIHLSIHSDGSVYTDYTDAWKDYKAIELPPHGDLIDRDEGIKIGAELAVMHGSDATTQELEKEYWRGYEDAMQRRDVKPVACGKWVLKTFDDGYGEYQLYECNLCGAVTAQRKSKNYCHNCGAKMESEK